MKSYAFFADHILWACPSTQDVWGTSNPKLKKCGRSYNDFMKLFEELSVLLNGEDLNLFALTSRGIWQRRNSVVHGGVFTHLNIVTNMDREGLLQYTGKYADAKLGSQR